MRIYIKLFLFLIFLLNKSQGNDNDVILLNDLTYNPSQNYEIIRDKRDLSPWFYPEIDKNQISCGHNVYSKLHTCSQLTECR